MVSEFRKKKYLFVFHKYLDTDKSGAIDSNDFKLAALNFAKLRGLKPGDALNDSLRDMMVQIWLGMKAQGDADGNGQITADEWVNMWDNFATNPAEWQTLYCKAVFTFTDYDNNGFIDENDTIKMCEQFGVSKEDAVKSFKALAQGKDKLSLSDYEKLWKDYFVSEDQSAPGNRLFGFK